MIKLWLPLNKDERNIGLGSGFPINSGVTFATGGPVGNYASFAPTNKFIVLPKDALTGMTDYCTVCFWMKLDAFGAAWQTVFAMLRSSQAWTGNVFTFIRNNNTSAFTFSISNGSSSTQASLLTDNLSLNTWYHFACVYKPGLMSLYQNGSLLRTYSTTIKPCFSAITHATLGIESNTSFSSIYYQHRGGISDVRVYDHELKDWEIKKIYNQCLYETEGGLHLMATNNLGGSSIMYKGRNYGQAYNASSWGGDKGTITYFKDGGYGNLPYKEYHKTASGSGGVFLAQTRDIEIQSGKTYTMSMYVKASRNFTDSAHAFNINGVIPGDSNHYITYGKNVQFTTEWNRIYRTFTATSAETGNFSEMSIVYNDTALDYYVYYSGFQIEEGNQMTEFSYGHRDETLVDASGRENQTTLYNIVQSGSSLYFNGSTSYVKIPPRNLTGGSVSVWVYVQTKQSVQRVIYFDATSRMVIGFLTDGKLCIAANGTSKSHDATDFVYGKWNHIVAVWDANKQPSALYINGKAAPNASSNNQVWGVSGSEAAIGRRMAGGNADYLLGYIRRLSVYGRQLTQEDALNLYLNGE